MSKRGKAAAAAKLFLRRGTNEGGSKAEGDEHAAGDVALRAHPARVGAEAVGDRAGEVRPERVAERSHTSEENAERENLCGDMSAGWIDELWEKGEEEEGGFWVEDVDDDALGEDASEGGSRGVGRGFERFVAAEFLDPKIDEIGGAEVFDDTESGGGRDEESRETEGGCGSVDESADANSQRGDQTRVAALADAAANNVENGGAGNREQNRGGGDEEQKLGMGGKHTRWTLEATPR